MKWITKFEKADQSFRVRTFRQAASARNSLKAKGHKVRVQKCKGYYELWKV